MVGRDWLTDVDAAGAISLAVLELAIAAPATANNRRISKAEPENMIILCGLLLVALFSPDFDFAIAVENNSQDESGQAKYSFFGRQLRIVVYHLRTGSDILLCIISTLSALAMSQLHQRK